MKINHYLHFEGKTETAFNFYQSVFGGEFTYLSRFGDLPDQQGMTLSEDQKNQIMHISLQINEHIELMGCDVLSSMMSEPLINGNNHAISINLNKDQEEAKRLFDVLSTGGQIKQPLETQFWGALFGSFTDQFGIEWMVNCSE